MIIKDRRCFRHVVYYYYTTWPKYPRCKIALAMHTVAKNNGCSSSTWHMTGTCHGNKLSLRKLLKIQRKNVQFLEVTALTFLWCGVSRRNPSKQKARRCVSSGCHCKLTFPNRFHFFCGWFTILEEGIDLFFIFFYQTIFAKCSNKRGKGQNWSSITRA